MSSMATPNHVELQLVGSMKGGMYVKRQIWAPTTLGMACVVVRVFTKSKKNWATNTTSKTTRGKESPGAKKLELARLEARVDTTIGPIGAMTATGPDGGTIVGIEMIDVATEC